MLLTNIIRPKCLIFFWLVLITVLSGCVFQETQADYITPNIPEINNSESEDCITMENSINLIIEVGHLERDSAEGTVKLLCELGISELESAELISNNRGIVLRVVDSSNHVYYLGYGGLGYLEIIRKDSEDGDILFAPEE